MNKKYFILVLLFVNSIEAKKLKDCSLPSHCNFDETCVSYTDCNGKQTIKCISTNCYRSGVCNKDGSIICKDKHCYDISCKNK